MDAVETLVTISEFDIREADKARNLENECTFLKGPGKVLTVSLPAKVTMASGREESTHRDMGVPAGLADAGTDKTVIAQTNKATDRIMLHALFPA